MGVGCTSQTNLRASSFRRRSGPQSSKTVLGRDTTLEIAHDLGRIRHHPAEWRKIMNSKDYQPQTSRFLHSATRWVCLFAAMLILCDLAASEALGQKNCLEAFKNCSACQQ